MFSVTTFGPLAPCVSWDGWKTRQDQKHFVGVISVSAGYDAAPCGLEIKTQKKPDRVSSVAVTLGTVFLLFIISSCISAEDTATRLETCETQIQTHVSQCSWTLNESLGVCLRSHFEERAEGSSPGGVGGEGATSEVRTIISIKQGHHCPLHPQVKPKIIRMADV